MRVVRHGNEDIIIADDKVIGVIQWSHIFDSLLTDPEFENYKDRVREAINEAA